MTHYNKFTYGDIEYTWNGGFGGIFNSNERNVKCGEVRVINNETFYCFMITKDFPLKPTVYWTQLDITIEKIREIKKRMFNIED